MKTKTWHFAFLLIVWLFYKNDDLIMRIEKKKLLNYGLNRLEFYTRAPPKTSRTHRARWNIPLTNLIYITVWANFKHLTKQNKQVHWRIIVLHALTSLFVLNDRPGVCDWLTREEGRPSHLQSGTDYTRSDFRLQLAFRNFIIFMCSILFCALIEFCLLGK